MAEQDRAAVSRTGDDKTNHSNQDAEENLVIVEEPAGRRAFHGRLITEVSTRAGLQARWTDLKLYKVTDEDAEYAVTNTGRSVLYHVLGGPCNLGVEKQVGKLTDDEFENLEPHDMTIERWPGDPKTLAPCNPADLADLNPEDRVSVEMDLHGVMKCANAADLIGKLHQERRVRGSTERDRFLSEPAQRLLRLAAEKDESIAAELLKVRKL